MKRISNVFSEVKCPRASFPYLKSSVLYMRLRHKSFTVSPSPFVNLFILIFVFHKSIFFQNFFYLVNLLCILSDEIRKLCPSYEKLFQAIDDGDTATFQKCFFDEEVHLSIPVLVAAAIIFEKVIFEKLCTNNLAKKFRTFFRNW